MMMLITRKFFWKKNDDVKIIELVDFNNFLAKNTEKNAQNPLYMDDFCKIEQYIDKVETCDIERANELRDCLQMYQGRFLSEIRKKNKKFCSDDFFEPAMGLDDQPKLKVDAMVRAIIAENPVYYDRSGRYWLWFSSEKIWIETDEVDIYNLCKRYIPDIDMYRKRSEMIFYFQTECRKNEPMEVPTHVIMFEDYAYNIKNGDRILPQSKYFWKQRIPYPIGDADAETPNIDKMLTSLVSNEEQLQQLKEILAYCLIREQLFDKMFFLIGSGSNGKSTYINFLRRCLGEDNCTSITSADITGKNAHGLTNCEDKLLIEWPEPTRYDLSNTSRFKQIVSGDNMILNPKNKNPIEIRIYGKFISPTNSLPQTMDKSDGFYRRLDHIIFEKKFTNKDRIPNISNEEISNFWAKCLNIAAELIEKRSMSKSLTTQEIKDMHEKLSNPVYMFLEEEMEVAAECNVPYWLLKELFLEWASDKGFGMFDDKEIKTMLANIGYSYGDMERKQFYSKDRERIPQVWRWINNIRFKKAVLQKTAIKRLDKQCVTQITQDLLYRSKLFSFFSPKLGNTVLSVLQEEKPTAEEPKNVTQKNEPNYEKFLLLIIDNKNWQHDDLVTEFEKKYFEVLGVSCDTNILRDTIQGMKTDGLIFEIQPGEYRRI